LIDDHKTETIRYAHELYVEDSCREWSRLTGIEKIPDSLLEHYDEMWQGMMTCGAESFLLDVASTSDDEIDFELAHFFIRVYQRDGWIRFYAYWPILKVTWKNYKAMGLSMFFERSEDYIRKDE
jgi:hypothetical protein